MAKLWQGYDKIMETVWQTYGKVMASLWQGYGKVLATFWQCYGKVMAKLWLFFLITVAVQIKNPQMPSPSKWFCNISYNIFVILYTQFHQLKFNLQIWARNRTHVSEVRSDAVTSCSGLGFFGHLCGCVLNIGYTTYTQNSTCRSETCLDLRGLFWILDFRMKDKER